jgi:carboxylesterase
MDWINAAESAYLEIARKCKSVFVLGESMGALLTLWLGRMHPEIKGLLVFAPALRIPHLWQSNFVWPFVNFLYKKNIDLSSPWQGFNVTPLRAASQLYTLQRRLKCELSKINQPILIFQGKLDKTIDPISSVEVLEGVSSLDKELVWLDESSHVILLDRQISIVRDLCLSFIEKKTN